MQGEKEIGGLPIVALVASLINTQDALPKLKCIEVDTTNDFYFANNARVDNAEQIFRSLIEIDSEGDFALRIGYHTTTGSTKQNKAELTILQHLRSVIGKTADGKPYLRLTVEPK